MNPRTLTPHLRRIAYLLAGMGVIYLYLRFDTRRLPEEGCSPLLRFAPGDRLLIDQRPEGFAVGDAVLVQADDGILYLALVRRLRSEDQELWVQTDAPDCPGRDSDDFGWVPVEEAVARVIMVWPW